MQLRHRHIDEPLRFKVQEEDSDLISHFIDVNKTIPSYYQLEGEFVWQEFMDTIAKYKDDHLITWRADYPGDYRMVVIQVVIKSPGKPSQVVFMRTGRSKYNIPSLFENFETSTQRKKYINAENESVLTFSDIDIFYSIGAGLPNELIKELNKIKMKSNEYVNVIHLICQDQDVGLYTKQLPITGTDYEFDLDLHYGDGFKDFHDKNVKRISGGTKGIILFYGPPGTGKSYYIKRLIKDLTEKNKKVLYLPNNMVDNLGTPAFNNFLMDWIDDNDASGKKKGVLMVIEDGERVLLKRDNNPYGADGVSNILNSTDGILNDFLNIQVLATFNTTIDQIDEAILRKKRALAIREFNKLSKDEAQRLIDSMDIKFQATEAMSLADIYALKEEEDDLILFKDAKKDQTKVGFRSPK